MPPASHATFRLAVPRPATGGGGRAGTGGPALMLLTDCRRHRSPNPPDTCVRAYAVGAETKATSAPVWCHPGPPADPSVGSPASRGSGPRWPRTESAHSFVISNLPPGGDSPRPAATHQPHPAWCMRWPPKIAILERPAASGRLMRRPRRSRRRDRQGRCRARCPGARPSAHWWTPRRRTCRTRPSCHRARNDA